MDNRDYFFKKFLELLGMYFTFAIAVMLLLLVVAQEHLVQYVLVREIIFVVWFPGLLGVIALFFCTIGFCLIPRRRRSI